MVYKDEAKGLIGKTVVDVQLVGDFEPDEVVLVFSDGTRAKFWHTGQGWSKEGMLSLDVELAPIAFYRMPLDDWRPIYDPAEIQRYRETKFCEVAVVFDENAASTGRCA